MIGMKTGKSIWLFLFVLFGCHSGQEGLASLEPSGQEVVLRLSSGLRQYASNRVPLPAGTQPGIFVVDMEQRASLILEDGFNVRCTSDAEGQLMSENPVRLSEGGNYKVYAYAPYIDGISKEKMFYSHGVDVLGCHKCAEIHGVKPDDCTGVLEFIHCTAQIRFIVEITDETAWGKLGATSVLKATGFLPQGRLNIAEGTVTGEGTPSELTVVKAAASLDAADEYHLESSPVCFFVVPDEAQTIGLRVTHQGVTHTGSITQVFRAGESYIFTIYLGSQSELSLEGTLVPWVYEDVIIDFN